jgi:hypothetical protein
MVSDGIKSDNKNLNKLVELAAIFSDLEFSAIARFKKGRIS